MIDEDTLIGAVEVAEAEALLMVGDVAGAIGKLCSIGLSFDEAAQVVATTHEIRAQERKDARRATVLGAEPATQPDRLLLRDDGSGEYRDTVALFDVQGDGPVWNQIACVGSFNGHPTGPFELTPHVFEEIVQNWVASGRKPIPIDYEHASEADATSGSIPTGGAPAQGWITQLENRGARGGLWGLIEWLPQAREQIRTKRYRFFSPAIRFGSRDKVTGRPIGARLTSGALTNQPFLDNLPEIKAKDAAPAGKPTDLPADWTAARRDWERAQARQAGVLLRDIQEHNARMAARAPRYYR